MAQSPKWLTAEEGRAWRHLSLMNFQLSAFLGRELTDDGLSYQDYSVLAGLSDQPDGCARLNEMGQQIGWEKSRMSHHVNRMEKRGLVEKFKCPTDGRGLLVKMTDAGREAIEAAAPGHVALVRKHFVDLLTPEQIATLDEIAVTVLEGLPDGKL